MTDFARGRPSLKQLSRGHVPTHWYVAAPLDSNTWVQQHFAWGQTACFQMVRREGGGGGFESYFAAIVQITLLGK